MTDDKDSFDPRTWRKPGGQDDRPSLSATPTAPPASPTSFDPRTWVGDELATKKTMPPRAMPAIEAMPERRNRRPLFAAAAGLAAVAIGGGVALWHRPPSTPPIAAASAGPVRPAPPRPGESTRTLVIAGPAALPAALASTGLGEDDVRAAAAAAAPGIAGRNAPLRVAMTLARDGDGVRLVRMEVAFDDSAGAVVTPGADGQFTAAVQAASLDVRVCSARGEMDGDNFYSSAVGAGVPDTLIDEITKALSFDFDFAREIDKGDVFEVGYRQSFNRAGKAVGIPRLEFVRMTTKDKSTTLYAFASAGGGAPEWFDGNGVSTVRALMRTPIDAPRVTSAFGMRDHPILHITKLHKGVDFGAPIGTPIYASGDAEVIGAVLTPTEGHMVKLRHPNGWITLYMHMSKILDNIVAGTHVRQGQEIGEVGTTGRSTGPHLHYQVEIDGVPVNPMALPMGEARPPLSGAQHDLFIKQRDKVDLSRRGSGRC